MEEIPTHLMIDASSQYKFKAMMKMLGGRSFEIKVNLFFLN